MKINFPSELVPLNLQPVVAVKNAADVRATLGPDDILYFLDALQDKIGVTGSKDPSSLDYRATRLETNTAPTFMSLTLAGLSQNSILFITNGGIVSQDNANLYWIGDLKQIRSRKIYLDSTNAFVERNSIVTVSRTNVLPTTSGVYMSIYVLQSSAGDNGATTRGYGGIYIKTIEESGQPRGVLYGVNISVAPTTENDPYLPQRDSTPFIIDNEGTVEASDAIYIGRGSSGGVATTTANPNGFAFITGLLVERDVASAFRLNGKVGVGIDLSAATYITGGRAIKVGLLSTSEFGNILLGVSAMTEIYSGYAAQLNPTLEISYPTSTPNNAPVPSLNITKNLSGTANALGGIGFANINIGAAEKRISAISVFTDGATNSGNLRLYTMNGGAFAERMRIDKAGNVYGTAGTTGMTDGFFYIPSAAGAPTGTPTAVTGHVPMYYDTTNNKFYIYSGAWKGVTLA